MDTGWQLASSATQSGGYCSHPGGGNAGLYQVVWGTVGFYTILKVNLKEFAGKLFVGERERLVVGGVEDDARCLA